MLWQTHTWALPYAWFFIPPTANIHPWLVSAVVALKCEVSFVTGNPQPSLRGTWLNISSRLNLYSAAECFPKVFSQRVREERASMNERAGDFNAPGLCLREGQAHCPYTHTSNVLTWAAHTNIFQATRNANKRLQRSHSSLPLSWNRGLKCTKTNMKHRDFHIWICVARCREMQLSNDNIKVRGCFFLVVNLFSSYLQHFFQTNSQNIPLPLPSPPTLISVFHFFCFKFWKT